ncbi:MAG TPA: TPM domain-containing protein [Nitrospira sp.]|nr:TPM domain-containing protein [Nitrospira sp.]
MAIGKRPHLSAEDRARISEAVRTAERDTKAEIVPMLVSRSGLYRDAQHRTGLILGLLVLSALLTLETAWLPWGWHASNAAWLLLGTVGAYALGVWLGTFPPVIRLVTSTERMRQKVRLRAERAFAQHDISQTKERTGVLLLLSLLERQVYVLPDKEVAQRIQASEWGDMVKIMTARLRTGDLVGGFCAGIERCGALLARACPVTSGHNPNEISDRVIEEP